MKNFNELKVEVQQKELEASTAIREAKALFDEKAREISSDRHLSAEGRRAKMSELRSQLQEELTDKLEKLREEHRQASQKALEAAREILVTSKHPVPSDAEIALFERELHDLKLNLTLTPLYNSALQLINEFTEKYEDGYFAEKILKEMPEFFDTVLNLAENKDEARIVLTRLKNTISDRAKTDEQRAAEQYLQYNSNPQFISQAGMDYRVLSDLFGASTAYRLINK